MRRLRELLSEISLIGREEILRRYFVINSFDGILTALGILLSAFISGNIQPETIISIVLAAGISMAVSGFFGAYTTEIAERSREIRELERALLSRLDKSMWKNMSGRVSVLVGMANGFSPLLMSIIILIPFFLHLNPILSSYLSLAISFSLLFLLGSYLGKVSKTSMLLNGLKMLLVGLFSSFLIFLVTGLV